jgi:hypothetical protein
MSEPIPSPCEGGVTNIRPLLRGEKENQMKAYELIDSPEKWVNHSSLGFELEQIMSIRELFASDRGLFANGRAFAIMEASCHRQVQRSVPWQLR